MLKIGCHLSAAKGFSHMGETALSIGANTFQFFMRNPRGTKARALDVQDIERLHALLRENNFAQIVAHAPYTLNGCSDNPGLRELSAQMLCDDLKRMEYLPHNLYVLHPGSCMKQDFAAAAGFIVHMLNKALTESQSTTVLLETMAGRGSEVGRTFEQIKAIMDLVDCSDRLGVCFDSAHLYAAGYDIVRDLDGVLRAFDTIIGLTHLRAFHLNDSMYTLGSHKDRHMKIGQGMIGLDAIVRIIRHPALHGLPFLLETPNELEGHAEEIKLLKALL